MATLIICPACDTRYQIKAAFPPGGRKVRCAKCGHVWQAQAAGPEAPVPTPPAPQAAPQPGPVVPPPAPKAPPPPPPPPPRAAPPAPPVPEFAPPPPPPPRATAPIPPAPEMAPTGMPPREDADFGSDDALAAQVARINAEAGVPETEAPPPPEAEPAKPGGLFGRLMGKRSKPAPPPPSDMAAPPPPSPNEDASFGAPRDAAFSAPGSLPASQDASFDAGFPDEGAQDPALADPDLVAAAFGESASKQKKGRKGLPTVAIGWGILALIVLIVVGMFAFARTTTVSILPGASRIYAMLGMPVGAEGLAFEGVRYGWTNDGGQTVLEVQGSVRNTGSATMAVPTVVIALRDENGDEISEWTTEAGAAELAAGEEAPFLRQIPSPPSNVRSLKVRFADANN